MHKPKWLIALAVVTTLIMAGCATQGDLNKVNRKVDVISDKIDEALANNESVSVEDVQDAVATALEANPSLTEEQIRAIVAEEVANSGGSDSGLTSGGDEGDSGGTGDGTGDGSGDGNNGGKAGGKDSDGVPGGDATMVFRNTKTQEGKDLPDDITRPDPSRQEKFPDVPFGGRPALVAYESPFEDGDFCDSLPCNMDVSQYYYRVMTAGRVTVPGIGVDCVATDTRGCLVVVINWFGETVMYRHNLIDHGFTIAGRVWDMGSPDKVTLAGQALLDHYAGRMTASEDGANCGVIEACDSLEWHLVVVGNGAVQGHWSGVYSA